VSQIDDAGIDVAVIGAGPAGTAAAITLARAGRKVLVVDKATFPRDKCCGDGLTTAALRLLDDLGLDPGRIPSWQPVHDIVVRGPRARHVTFSLPRGRGTFAAVARRTELDAALVDLAGRNGVEVRTAQALTGATGHADRVALEIDGLGMLDVPWVIGADGMWSPLRRALGERLEHYRGDWHAFRQYFTNVSDRASRELMIWFDADLLPGYAWSFPLGDGRVNFGFGILRGSRLDGAAMGRRWDDLLERPHIRAFIGEAAAPEGQRKAWPIPTRLPGPTLAAGRALFVGDAAALGDPMTGEGIGQALASGIAAARAIVDHPESPVAVDAAYRTWVAQHLEPDTRMANLLSRALKHRKGARAAIATAGLTPWTRRKFARWLFEDEPRGVLFTPKRLHLRFLRRDGAFAEGPHAD
jgi:geranylgeranyl reductase family protein